MAFRETITELMVKVGADISQLTAKFKVAEKDVEKFGRKMQTLGSRMTIGVSAPLLALGVASVKAFADAEDAIAQVESAVKSTGMAAGKTTDQLEKAATALMKISVYDDDEILGKVTANLLTFTRVTGDTFDKAQLAVLNLASRLKMDLQSATIMVGKALNDPVAGLTALRRAGVQLTDDQADLVKRFVEVNDIASAQKIILGELETQFGGAAQAAAAAGSGPFKQLANEIGNLQEEIGEKLMPVALDLVKWARDLVSWFTSLPDGVQSVATKFGVLAVALGPVVWGLGQIVKLSAVLAGSAGFKALLALVASSGALVAAAAAVGGIVAYGATSYNTRARSAGAMATDGKSPGFWSSPDAIAAFGAQLGLRPLTSRQRAAMLGSGLGGAGTGAGDGLPPAEVTPPGELFSGIAPERVTTIAQLADMAALSADEVERLGQKLDDVNNYLVEADAIDPEPLKPDNWSRLKEEITRVNEQVKTLAADSLVAMSDVLSNAIGQFVTLQTSFKDFVKSVVKGFQQIIGQIVATIVKQQILNALWGGGGAAGAVGLGALAGVLGPLAIAGIGVAAVSGAFGGRSGGASYGGQMAVSGVVLRSGDIRFSVEESRAVSKRIGG